MVIAGHLILGDDFHDHILVDIVPLIVEDDSNPEEIQQFTLLVLLHG